MKTISLKRARELKLESLTRTYNTHSEYMIAPVIELLQLNRINHAIVEVPGGVEIWRTRIGMKIGLKRRRDISKGK